MNISLQTLRKYAKSPEKIYSGKNAGEPVFYYFGDLLPCAWADDVCRGARHTGWLTNADGETFKDGSGKARGSVIQLPPAPGFHGGRFLAGYWWGDNGEYVFWPELYKDETEAARAADSHAEAFAESAREDSERFDAMQDAENETEEKEREFKLAFMARHVSPEHAELAREALEELRSAREVLASATADYERG